jgi:5-methylthioadenosine/S-adenosylhomocysteine deaminase
MLKPILMVGLAFVLTACAQAPARNTALVDLIILGDHIVTMDADERVIENGAVAVDDGRIVAIGPRDEIIAGYWATEVLSGDNRVVMPGLINGHTHAAMSLLRGIADDLALEEWLMSYIFPTEVRFVNAEFVRIGTELACWEMIRGGTTTFVDMYYFPDAVAEAVERCGLRALVAPTVIDQQSPDAANGQDSLDKAVAFVKRWQGRSNRVIPIISAHAVYTVPPELLIKTRQEARALNVPISIHISETQAELATSTQRYQATPVQLLDQLGFLDGPTIGAHLVWPSAAEIQTLAEKRTGVVHNPTSNMKISSGIAPVTEMLKHNVLLGLGTDGPASNNDLDMWEEMRLASFLQKVSSMDPEALPARTVLRMATAGGAEAIGLGDQIGSLTVGRRADLIQVDLDDVHFVPTYDVMSHLVFVADEQDVAAVVVDGRVVMRDRNILTLDENRIRREAQAMADKIRRALAERGVSGN